MSLLTSSSLSVTYISQIYIHFAIWLCYVNSNRIKQACLCAQLIMESYWSEQVVKRPEPVTTFNYGEPDHHPKMVWSLAAELHDFMSTWEAARSLGCLGGIYTVQVTLTAAITPRVSGLSTYTRSERPAQHLCWCSQKHQIIEASDYQSCRHSPMPEDHSGTFCQCQHLWGFLHSCQKHNSTDCRSNRQLNCTAWICARSAHTDQWTPVWETGSAPSWMKPFLMLREAVHLLFEQSRLGMHPSLQEHHHLSHGSEQNNYSNTVQMKGAGVAACCTNSRSQDDEKERYDRVLLQSRLTSVNFPTSFLQLVKLSSLWCHKIHKKVHAGFFAYPTCLLLTEAHGGALHHTGKKYPFFCCKLLEQSLVCFEMKDKFQCLMLSNHQEL